MPVVTGFANKGPQDVGGAPAYSLGPQLFDPSLYAGGGGHSYVDNLTAAPAASGQAGAAPLTQSINRVTTAAANGDGVALPAATGGQILVVRNASPVAIQVYPMNGSSDLLNAASTSVAVGSMKTVMFCSTQGRWFSLLSA